MTFFDQMKSAQFSVKSRASPAAACIPSVEERWLVVLSKYNGSVSTARIKECRVTSSVD